MSKKEHQLQVDELKTQARLLQHRLQNAEARITQFMNDIAYVSNRVVDLEYERDALAAQVESHSDALKALLKTVPWFGVGGSLQADGQFYYKVAESVFQKAQAALSITPQQALAEIRAKAIESAVTYLTESIPDKSHESVIFKDRYAYISNRYLREYSAKVRKGGK